MIEYMCSHDHYSPIAKEIGHKIKGENVQGGRISDKERDEAVAIAGREMAVFVPKGVVLIPIPSRFGYATDTLLLANEIARQSGAVVRDVLKGKDRASSYSVKKDGKVLKNEDFGFYLTEEVSEPVIYIDNVIASGATARAVYSVREGIFLVYAVVSAIRGFCKRKCIILQKGNMFCRHKEMTKPMLL